MKKGKTITELAAEIQRQAETKKDFLVKTEGIKVRPALGVAGEVQRIRMDFGDQRLNIGDTAHAQIGTHLGIPKAYYDKMLTEAPELLGVNINAWFQKYPSRQMVRTLDGKARAFLSDKYRPMDNLELAEAVLPVLGELGVEVISAEITEKRLYIKAIDKAVSREIPNAARLGEGHEFVKLRELHPSICISNSEIGHGSLSVQGGTFDQFCTNLSYFAERSTKKYHVGQRHGEFAEDQVFAMLSDKTRQLNDAALWSTIRDVVRGAFDVARFDALVGKITGTQEQKLTGDIPKVVELAAARWGFNDGERKSVLDHLIHGGDLTRFGLYNAVTRTAEDLADYDRATEFERFGGQLIELPASEWRQLAEAA